MNAYEWGILHNSCRDALEARKALGPEATQADWYRACKRGDWLLWQLGRLTPEVLDPLRPAIQRFLDMFTERAIRSVLGRSGCPAWEQWAERWLSGEDRVAKSADAARDAAMAGKAWRAADVAWSAWAAAAAKHVSVLLVAATAAAAAAAAGSDEERALQANEIRAAIPAWPGGEA